MEIQVSCSLYGSYLRAASGVQRDLYFDSNNSTTPFMLRTRYLRKYLRGKLHGMHTFARECATEASGRVPWEYVTVNHREY